MRKSRSEIGNKITSHKFILVEICYFYQFLGFLSYNTDIHTLQHMTVYILVNKIFDTDQKWSFPEVSTHFRPL